MLLGGERLREGRVRSSTGALNEPRDYAEGTLSGHGNKRT